MREVGRFAVLESRRLTDFWVRRVVDYVVSRQNEDGGYTFYAASILKAIREQW